MATASHDRAKGEIGGAGEASNGPDEANSTVNLWNSRPLNASVRLQHTGKFEHQRQEHRKSRAGRCNRQALGNRGNKPERSSSEAASHM